ncbi:glycosyltransferase [Candidatus Chloroploca sp. M-50]|uniref:Glycosyltransferase n=1 Tax=Candidatus Chloroploca mongolica TaxID=2528176 RepID=A0ABS4DCK6_9CHLR|nr:glycosyltransferase [Candidatus Chloroploca mongolica]MBP1467169.1 glycosyltransferase [Candidatus Chloroploca mongolica]
MTHRLDRLAQVLGLLYLLDRLWKILAVVAFFRRPPPPVPTQWPSLTLLCPMTRSPNDLRSVLIARAHLVYPGQHECLLICDREDVATQAICTEVMERYPTWPARIVLAEPEHGTLASKIAKLRTALPEAHGEVLCFVDDDILLRPDTLRILVPYVMQPTTGAAFGLACYTRWQTLAESLMSGFVNTNALLSYVPVTYLVEPFTITGHCFALRREVFTAIGGLEGMEERIDDDHELARRVRRYGLRNVQTPLVYDVDNRLARLRDYHLQMRRWLVIPRQAMLPHLNLRERSAMLFGSLGNLLPPLLLLLALVTRRRVPWLSLGSSLGYVATTQALIERIYLGQAMPLRQMLLLPILNWLTPLYVSVISLGSNTIVWRGQRLRVERGGTYAVIEE